MLEAGVIRAPKKLVRAQSSDKSYKKKGFPSNVLSVFFIFVSFDFKAFGGSRTLPNTTNLIENVEGCN